MSFRGSIATVGIRFLNKGGRIATSGLTSLLAMTRKTRDFSTKTVLRVTKTVSFRGAKRRGTEGNACGRIRFPKKRGRIATPVCALARNDTQNIDVIPRERSDRGTEGNACGRIRYFPLSQLRCQLPQRGSQGRMEFDGHQSHTHTVLFPIPDIFFDITDCHVGTGVPPRNDTENQRLLHKNKRFA